MNNTSIFKKILYFLTIPTLLISNVFAEEINTNSSKINRCITCHTITGNSTVGAWPKLAEQHKDYMIKQLFEYKKGKEGNRYDITMFGMLNGVSDDEINELAEHFSKQTLQKNKNKNDISKIELGKKIYLYGKNDEKITGCVGCHGMDGTGNKLANFPSLKWQHKEYLITQLKKFKTNERSNDINGIMRDIAFNMTDEHIDAVASYISSID